MSFFGKLIKAGIDTIAIPVAVVKDVATLGGSILGKSQPYTISKLKDIGKDIQEAKDEL